MSIGRRVGAFSLVLGILLILYFVFSASAQTIVMGALLGGIALVGLGFLMIVTHPSPPPPDSGRFRVLRRKPHSESRNPSSERRKPPSERRKKA